MFVGVIQKKKHLSPCMLQYCYLKGDPVRTAVEAAEAEPDCAMAHAAIGLLSCIGQAAPLDSEAIAGRLAQAQRVVAAGLGSERDAAFTQVRAALALVRHRVLRAVFYVLLCL
jgi:hypothetical protein